jgi:hypothetical protein
MPAKGEGGQMACDKAVHRSGWRDLNSRPLDPQIGGLVVSCAPELRFMDCGGG